jgi:hypothetical protein
MRSHATMANADDNSAVAECQRVKIPAAACRTGARQQPNYGRRVCQGSTCGPWFAAAIANAVYHATDKRIPDLPITPDKLL